MAVLVYRSVIDLCAAKKNKTTQKITREGVENDGIFNESAYFL